MSNYLVQNNAGHCSVDDKVPFAQGTFKKVFKGVYTNGERVGKDCVEKQFKTGSVFEASYFDMELKVVEVAHQFVVAFNERRIAPINVLLIQPSIWTRTWTGAKSIVEPMLHDFKKINSNTGWTSSETFVWIEILQALSHFSYHESKGELLLCDIQGQIEQKSFTMTDPVIIQQLYGPSDLGCPGISTFFSSHTCNKYCNKNWIRPSNQNRYYKKSEGSSMTLPVERFARMSMGAGDEKADAMMAQFDGLEIIHETE